MRVLVTGGGGYIGSHLVQALRRGGYAVSVLDTEPAPSTARRPPGVDFQVGGVTDPDDVLHAVHGVDAVCHLAWRFIVPAAQSGPCPEFEHQEIRENILGTLTVLEAARRGKVSHLLFAGTAVVYGPTGTHSAGEEDALHPERSTLGGAVYGITKLACEKLCLLYRERGLPVTVFRLHGVFSEGRLGQFGQMVEDALAGDPVMVIRGAGGEYVHLDDVLAAFRLAIANDAAVGEVFNLAGAHTYTDSELAQLVIDVAGTPSRIEWVDDPGKAMISLRTDKLRRALGFRHSEAEFLSPLLRRALASRKR